jgi:predicted secreted protein
MKRVIFSSFLICMVSFFAFGEEGGDQSVFVDLGFNSDASVYMFAQYGIEAGSFKPWAEVSIVNVASNDFVPGGRLSYTAARAVNAGQDGSGALYHLLVENAGIIQDYGFSFTNQGRLLYLVTAEGGSNTEKAISFRDFAQNASYKASLVPSIEGKGKNLKSSSYIKLNAEGSAVPGGSATYLVGDPRIKRALITGYRFCRVIAVPGDSPNTTTGLVFVIETRKQVSGGFDIRYMVETLKF